MILNLKLPMQGPLDHVNAYLVKEGNESVLIDTGLPTQELVLTEYLRKYGNPDYVIITHYHPDHIGLVRLFKNSKILIHEKEIEYLNYILGNEYEREMKNYLTLNGFPESVVERMFKNVGRFRELIKDVSFNEVTEGDIVRVGSSEMRILWTPGHTIGHICIDYNNDILFCGDHILPNVTPNVSLLRIDDDPLRAYLESLDKIEKINAKIYPAHGEPIENVKKRIEEIKQHHMRRLEEILKIIESKGKANGFEIATSISWYKRWDDLSPFDKQLAIGETLAHIKYLLNRNAIEEINVNNSIYYTRTS
ncbi:MAG: MBL fold metallo-hydrolase [Saccharolobus sp.]